VHLEVWRVVYGMIPTLRVPLFGFGRRGIGTRSCRGVTGGLPCEVGVESADEGNANVLKLTLRRR
jgi:hypothetical protein